LDVDRTTLVVVVSLECRRCGAGGGSQGRRLFCEIGVA
jgi:hypothetical protein